VKKSDVWEKLPWFAAYQAYDGPRDKPTLYRLADRSYVLIFASSSTAAPIGVESIPPDPGRFRP
jgi:hypothetical protein